MGPTVARPHLQLSQIVILRAASAKNAAVWSAPGPQSASGDTASGWSLAAAFSA